MDFRGKTVLVTGSSKGIGRQIIYDFARLGANVVINYSSDSDGAFRLEKEIMDKFDCKVLTVRCDVSNETDVKYMIDSVISRFKSIDILVNNAGVCNDSMFDDKNYDDFNRVLSVNLIGTYLVSKYVCKYMVSNKFGKVINISSDNGICNGYPESAEYDASKAGVISLTHNMAKFYAPYVSVNCVCPGWINTSMNEGLDSKQISDINSKILLNRFGDVKEISNVVLFLASSAASYVNDSIINVNGGSL